MAQAFGISVIRDFQRYWLEQIPYTVLLASVPANSTQSLFSVQNWNPPTDIGILAAITAVGATPFPDLQLQIVHDNRNWRGYADALPGGLGLQPVESKAVRNLAFSITNRGSTALVNVQINYVITLWRMPVAYKLMAGYALTPEEANQAQRLGLPVSAVDQRGTFPIPLSAVIERTYANRSINSVLEIADHFPATTTEETIAAVTARPNELLVLRNIAALASVEDGVVLSVDRDDNPHYVEIRADALDLDRGLDMFIPALRTLTFKIRADVAPPAPIPVRITVWHLSLSNILRVRLGLLSFSQLQALMGSAAQDFWDRVWVGVS